MDDRFHNHRKVLRLRRSDHYGAAIAVWTLAMSWCCAQEKERFTGEVPLEVVETFGLAEWKGAAAALVDVGLWEKVDGADTDTARFHDWNDWNGIGGKEYRSKEQSRLRKQAERVRKCEAGDHSKDCPTDPPCPVREERHAASRDAGTGRDGTGSGRDGTGSNGKVISEGPASDPATREVDPAPVAAGFDPATGELTDPELLVDSIRQRQVAASSDPWSTSGQGQLSDRCGGCDMQVPQPDWMLTDGLCDDCLAARGAA